ncbi:hypothetical protein MKEN_01345600 [Mycena kentingensis (nom. inval.)]|nr:hypothetical protein MKEN_01345600 [Mycena kentingensis (nom. inval.)]
MSTDRKMGFSVAGMASTSTNHNPSWGSSTTHPHPNPQLQNSFTDSLTMSQSRAHYQSGYIMGASQSNNAPTSNQRVDEPPVVQTKAKMNAFAMSRGGHAQSVDFGMDSMFQSARHRQAMADEDAPPMNSVNDIPTEMYADSSSSSFQPRSSALAGSAFGRPKPPPVPATPSSPTLYIIVFGYPADKYSLTVEYFKSLGDASDADPHAEISNCFKIGYRDPADAMRAVRKNGEVLGGSWMVGAKWADSAAAEALLSQPFGASMMRHTSPEPNPSMAMVVDSPSPTPAFGAHTPMVGTPIRLAPSSSAFRRPGTVPPAAATKPSTPAMGSELQQPPPQSSPSKSVLGQVSDMIFGW